MPLLHISAQALLLSNCGYGSFTRHPTPTTFAGSSPIAWRVRAMPTMFAFLDLETGKYALTVQCVMHAASSQPHAGKPAHVACVFVPTASAYKHRAGAGLFLPERANGAAHASPGYDDVNQLCSARFMHSPFVGASVPSLLPILTALHSNASFELSCHFTLRSLKVRRRRRIYCWDGAGWNEAKIRGLDPSSEP